MGFFFCLGAICACVMYVAYRLSVAFQRPSVIVVKCAKCGAEEEGEES